MRVTNGMIVNTTLNGLYNNINTLNKIYAQMATGKKIQTVSDDPIIAGRALKLKSTVLETVQYQKNVKEATSWMEVTEVALDNMTEILKTIRTKCVEASTGTLGKDDKETVRKEIAQLWKQLQQEANNSYGGRYVFSGFKTKDPLVLTESLEIKGKDLQVEQDNMIIGSETPVAEDSTLKGGSQISTGSVLGKDTKADGEFTLGVNTVLGKEDTEALLGIKLEKDKYFFDAPRTLKTGTEITREQAEALRDDLGIDMDKILDLIPLNEDKFVLPEDIEVGKDKGKGLRNDVSKALFKVEGSETSYTTTVEHPKQGGHTFKEDVTIGAGSKFNGDVTTKGDTVLAENSVVVKDSVFKEGTKLGKGTLNPDVVGNIKGHAMEYEIGVNSTIGVNVQGMDGIFGELSNCLNEIFLTLDHALNDDEAVTTTDLHNMFTGKLDELDEMMKKISEVTSDLGSRMSRVEYVGSRLTDQELTFSNLLTETEDIDIEETYTNFNVQYATYQSALQATSKIITNTLADYL